MFKGVDLELGARQVSTSRWTRWESVFVALFLLIGAACGKATSPSSDGERLSLPALKLAVLDAVGGHLAYCDPDVYPVGHGTPEENALARFPTIRGDSKLYNAILQQEELSANEKFTPDQFIAINDDYKQMQVIELSASADGYAFDLQVPSQNSETGIQRLTGTVSSTGTVTISNREVGQRPNCPICLASGVLIATPNGNVPVQDVRVGMQVWTTDQRGDRVVGLVLETGHMEAPLGHEVVRMSLADGRSVVASPGHPTADGRTVGTLRPGDRYDGTVVARVVLLPYTGKTWDLLPSGPTGTYFADNVLLGSTLLRSDGGRSMSRLFPNFGEAMLLPAGSR